MSMSMLNAVGSANQSISQFMFLGSNEWALADAATLNLLASGTTSVNLAAGVTGGFAAPGVFLGLSGPSSVGGDAFAFQINANTGAFTTYDLPSDFIGLTSYTNIQTSTATYNNSGVVYVSAVDTSDAVYGQLINLSSICGVVSGGTAILEPSVLNTTTLAYNLVITSEAVYLAGVGNANANLFYVYIPLDMSMPEAAYQFGDHPSFDVFGTIGASLFMLSSEGLLLINPTNGALEYTIQSSSMITPQNAFAYGDNLFLLNYTNNQAQSVNLANPASPQFSPVFPLDLSSSGTAPGFSWMDPSTGVYYQNVSGASTFANLSPMQF